MIHDEPRCPVHGQMRLRLGCDPAPGGVIVRAWTCAGFDGEGCDYILLDADVAWVRIGESDSTRLEFRTPAPPR